MPWAELLGVPFVCVDQSSVCRVVPLHLSNALDLPRFEVNVPARRARTEQRVADVASRKLARKRDIKWSGGCSREGWRMLFADFEGLHFGLGLVQI